MLSMSKASNYAELAFEKIIVKGVGQMTRSLCKGILSSVFYLLKFSNIVIQMNSCTFTQVTGKYKVGHMSSQT